MLSDKEIFQLAKMMNVPLEFCNYKDKLPQKLELNKGYIINMQSSTEDEDGSHWTCFISVDYPLMKTVHSYYFDSFGQPPPEIVNDRIMDNYGHKPKYNTKDIQSLIADCCGYYALAFLYWITVYESTSGELYKDAKEFESLFDDLNKSRDFKKNEYVLQLFFRPASKELREKYPINLDSVKIHQTVPIDELDSLH